MADKNMWEIEDELYAQGIVSICGVDEAGRGPLAGPVCAAAVILPQHLEIPGLDDSKKLSDKRRRELFPIIKEQALAYGIGLASHEEINEINILQATFLAMQRAIDQLEGKADFALIDGNCSRGFDIPTQTIVKGDAISASIAAASILAKVTRDRQCAELDKLYPEYNIAKHKGYPTKEHMDAVRKYGPAPIYRMTFLKFLDRE